MNDSITTILMSPPDVGVHEEEAALRALRSGWVAPTGPEVTAFENDMAERLGVGNAVALSSGTAALHLALLAVGARPGTVVMVPTMTFVASANAVTYTGADPYFVDVLADDGTLDPDLLREAIDTAQRNGLKVAAVMSVDLLGVCANNDAIAKVCADAEVQLVEDAAEALGATDPRGRPAGSFGAVAALSFNGNKIMTTSGGGMLVSHDARLAEHARFLSTQAREPVVHYEHEHVGFNYRMSNVLAAIGRAQLTRLDGMIERRRQIRGTYRQLFATIPGTRIFADIGTPLETGAPRSNCWLTSIIVEPSEAGFTAAMLGEHLRRAGIESRPLWKPMHRQPVFEDHPRTVTGTADHLFEHGLTLPSGSRHDDDVIDRVVDVIREFMESMA